jgi:hypothetical protein
MSNTSKKEFAMEKNGFIQLFENVGLSMERINHLSIQTGFMKRCRKIKAVEFLVCLIAESIRGCVSCNDLAAVIQAETGTMASRQAYHHKMSHACLQFFKAIEAVIMRSKTDTVIQPQFKRFKRILVQDSTVIKLPSKLIAVFSGVKNAISCVCNARIQSVFNLRSGFFTQWSIDSYSKNDFAAAPELQVDAGDLILRDRGYFTTRESQRLMETQADFVSRYMYPTTLYDGKTGQPLDLLKMLSIQGCLDDRVLIGKDKRTEVRLIAIEVSQETAGRRRQKARECHGHNPCKEVLFLMGWTIFLTSLTSNEFTVEDILELYGLRWRIETIFKAWKSHLGFDKLHTVGEIQLKIILTARFIAILLFYEKIYVPLLKTMNLNSSKTLSMMKLMRYISRNFTAIPQLLKAAGGFVKSLRIVEKYCVYDKRKRPNFAEKERNILTTINMRIGLT